MEVLLRVGDALVPVSVDKPDMVVVVRRRGSAVPEHFALSGVTEGGKLVYAPAAAPAAATT